MALKCKDREYVQDKRYSEACKLASSKKIIRNLFNPLIKTRFIRLRSASQMEHALNSLMKFTKTEEKLKKTDEIRGCKKSTSVYNQLTVLT